MCGHKKKKKKYEYVFTNGTDTSSLNLIYCISHRKSVHSSRYDSANEWMNANKWKLLDRKQRKSKRKKHQEFRNKTNQIKMLSQVKPNRYKRIHTANTFVSIAMIAIKKSRYSLENAQQSPNKNRKSSSKSKSDEKKSTSWCYLVHMEWL